MKKKKNAIHVRHHTTESQRGILWRNSFRFLDMHFSLDLLIWIRGVIQHRLYSERTEKPTESFNNTWEWPFEKPRFLVVLYCENVKIREFIMPTYHHRNEEWLVWFMWWLLKLFHVLEAIQNPLERNSAKRFAPYSNCPHSASFDRSSWLQKNPRCFRARWNILIRSARNAQCVGITHYAKKQKFSFIKAE